MNETNEIRREGLPAAIAAAVSAGIEVVRVLRRKFSKKL